MPRTRLFRLFALAATLSLSSCIDDDVQTPVDPGEAFLLAYFVNDVGYRDTMFTLISTPLE